VSKTDATSAPNFPPRFPSSAIVDYYNTYFGKFEILQEAKDGSVP